MKLRSNNKKTNQWLLHSNKIESFRDGRLVEFERGLDKGYAVVEENKVVELFVRNKREFDDFKADRSIDEIIEELNEDWLINKI